MPISRCLFACVLMVLALGARAQSAAELNLAVSERHVQPGYARLSATTTRLNEAARAFCDKPDAHALSTLRERFVPAFNAWQGIQHIRFGPVQLFMREFRFHMWPDKRGTVGKHLRRELTGGETAPVDARAFATGSVAIQGFSALERLVFSKDAQALEASTMLRRCRLLRAIGANLESMATELEVDWAKAPPASDVEARSADLLAAINNTLELIVAQKLALPLGSGIDTARGTLAEAWRSQLALSAIRENLSATRDLYRTGFAPRVGDTELAKAIESAWTAALLAIDAIPMPLAEAVGDARARSQVEAARERIAMLKSLISKQLAPRLGLALGFNSLDGD